MKIEKDIPIPEPTKKAGGSKYKFHEMEVGDSFFVEGVNLHSSPYQLAQQHGRNYGKRFTGRKVDGGIRIWRIE